MKAAAVVVACEIVRFWLPEFFKVSVCVCAVPTCTLAQVKLVGLVTKLPAATAMPERAMFRGLPVELLVTARVPFAFPTA